MSLPATPLCPATTLDELLEGRLVGPDLDAAVERLGEEQPRALAFLRRLRASELVDPERDRAELRSGSAVRASMALWLTLEELLDEEGRPSALVARALAAGAAERAADEPLVQALLQAVWAVVGACRAHAGLERGLAGLLQELPARRRAEVEAALFGRTSEQEQAAVLRGLALPEDLVRHAVPAEPSPAWQLQVRVAALACSPVELEAEAAAWALLDAQPVAGPSGTEAVRSALRALVEGERGGRETRLQEELVRCRRTGSQLGLVLLRHGLGEASADERLARRTALETTLRAYDWVERVDPQHWLVCMPGTQRTVAQLVLEARLEQLRGVSGETLVGLASSVRACKGTSGAEVVRELLATLDEVVEDRTRPRRGIHPDTRGGLRWR